MSSKKKALQVAVRCRPPGRGEGSAVVSADGGSCSVQSGDECAVFSFDRSFGPEESQHAVYDALIAEPMEALFDGYNCTVLAYGQTGSGKTHSMLGTPDEPGIIPRFGRELFERASVHEGARVFVSYTQLYNEGFYDLLEPQSGAELKLRRSETRGVHVQGLAERRIFSAAELQQLVAKAEQHRVVAATTINASSSRSHTILTLTLSMPHERQRGRQVMSRANLVDLAGSERFKAAGDDLLRPGVDLDQPVAHHARPGHLDAGGGGGKSEQHAVPQLEAHSPAQGRLGRCGAQFWRNSGALRRNSAHPSQSLTARLLPPQAPRTPRCCAPCRPPPPTSTRPSTRCSSPARARRRQHHHQEPRDRPPRIHRRRRRRPAADVTPERRGGRDSIGGKSEAGSTRSGGPRRRRSSSADSRDGRDRSEERRRRTRQGGAAAASLRASAAALDVVLSPPNAKPADGGFGGGGRPAAVGTGGSPTAPRPLSSTTAGGSRFGAPAARRRRVRWTFVCGAIPTGTPTAAAASAAAAATAAAATAASEWRRLRRRRGDAGADAAAAALARREHPRVGNGGALTTVPLSPRRAFAFDGLDATDPAAMGGGAGGADAQLRLLRERLGRATAELQREAEARHARERQQRDAAKRWHEQLRDRQHENDRLQLELEQLREREEARKKVNLLEDEVRTFKSSSAAKLLQIESEQLREREQYHKSRLGELEEECGRLRQAADKRVGEVEAQRSKKSSCMRNESSS